MAAERGCGWRPAAFTPARCPIFAIESEPGWLFYGLPDLGRGVKVALHHQGDEVDPNDARREQQPRRG